MKYAELVSPVIPSTVPVGDPLTDDLLRDRATQAVIRFVRAGGKPKNGWCSLEQEAIAKGLAGRAAARC